MTPETTLLDKVVLIVLGWLLGLAAPMITDAVKRKRENELGRMALLAELREVAHKLALAAHGVYMHQGSMDRSKLEWLKSALERYAGAHDPQRLLESMRKQLTMTDQEIARTSKAFAKLQKAGLVLQKYGVPLLDARVSALWTFDTSFTRELLEIKASLDILDDLVDRSRHYSDLTFGKLEGDNYRLVLENFEQCVDMYAVRARQIVTRIEGLGHV